MGRNAVGQTDLAVIDGLVSPPRPQSTAAPVSLNAGFPSRLLLCTWIIMAIFIAFGFLP